jgi:hypothetical protein
VEALVPLALAIDLCPRTPNLLNPSNFVAEPILPDESSGAVYGDHLQGT